MKGLILIFLLSVLFFICIAGCGEESTYKEFNDDENLVAYLDGANTILYVKPEFRDTTLSILLSNEFIEDSSALYIIETGSPLTFTHFFDSLWVDSTMHYYPGYSDLKIYINSDCNKVHPGFTSDCIGTFGEHRIWGRSMRWRVNTWKSCSTGSNICIETYERIGYIEYFNDPNCMSLIDTQVITRGIYEWACAN